MQILQDISFSLQSRLSGKKLKSTILNQICLKIQSTKLQFLLNKTVDSTPKIKGNLQPTVMCPTSTYCLGRHGGPYICLAVRYAGVSLSWQMLVRAKCVHPVEQLRQVTIFVINLLLTLTLLPLLFKTPEVVGVGFRTFAWAPNKNRIPTNNNYLGTLPSHYHIFGGTRGEIQKLS